MDLFDRLSLARPRLRLLREEPLAAHTSFRIGGPAEVMAFPSSLAELQALLRLSAQEGIRVRLLGAGTNILAPDGGVRGLVIVTSGALTGLSMPDAAHIEAMSGVTAPTIVLSPSEARGFSAFSSFPFTGSAS